MEEEKVNPSYNPTNYNQQNTNNQQNIPSRKESFIFSKLERTNLFPEDEDSSNSFSVLLNSSIVEEETTL